MQKIITSTGDINVSYLDDSGHEKTWSEKEYIHNLFLQSSGNGMYITDTFVMNPSDEYRVINKDCMHLNDVLVKIYNTYK